jgi:hypothetical protein
MSIAVPGVIFMSANMLQNKKYLQMIGRYKCARYQCPSAALTTVLMVFFLVVANSSEVIS